MKIIGMDIGGTKISAALIDGNRIVKKESVPTPYDQPKEIVLNTVTVILEHLFDRDITGIGIGVPGLVDLEKNLVLDVLNIPSWETVSLKAILEDHFHKPVFVNNDANCFALGEKYFGKGKKYRNFVGVSLGTGLGTGIIINDHLYSGRYCGAGEFGLLIYKDKCLEAYASGQFFKDQGLSGADLAKQAGQGGAEAIRLFRTLGEHLGRAMIDILFALAPEAVILGGSVSRSYHLFEESMRSVLEKEFPYQRLYRALNIEISDLKDSAIFGASSLVLENMGI
ncbi:MAG: ROK family protein [Chlorobi bacterium]|nr:ROK family protein [Chlorobiota bacterium]